MQDLISWLGKWAAAALLGSFGDTIIVKRNVQYSQLYANDKNRFDEARGELNLILDEPALEGLPLLIYCNKQDLSDAMRPSEIEQKLDLADRRQNVIIVGCTAYTGEGIHKGLSLLAQMLEKTASLRRTSIAKC